MARLAAVKRNGSAAQSQRIRYIPFGLIWTENTAAWVCARRFWPFPLRSVGIPGCRAAAVLYVFSAMVGMARCAVPARVVAGATNIRATLAFGEVAPLHAARTSQRDVPTTLNTYPAGRWRGHVSSHSAGRMPAALSLRGCAPD